MNSISKVMVVTGALFLISGNLYAQDQYRKNFELKTPVLDGPAERPPKVSATGVPASVSPPVVSPTAVAPTAVAPTAVAPTAVAPKVVAPTVVAPTATRAPKISLGNGIRNWIVVEGITRNEKVLIFPEVHIEGNGWLVIHPFENGKPNGDKYVAATYLPNGTSVNVPARVYKGIETDEKFIAMLHRDVNENGILDFVFISDTGVLDAAVFEGRTMIAHAISAP